MSKPFTILGVGDSPHLETGFARVNRNLASRWAASGCMVDWWGIGYRGWDRTKMPYLRDVFPAGGAGAAGDWACAPMFGLLLTLLNNRDYDAVFFLQDMWQFTRRGVEDFPAKLLEVCRAKQMRSVFYFPVDAPLEPDWTSVLKACTVAVAYCDYGREEAIEKAARADLNLKVVAIPHGVDTGVYNPGPDFPTTDGHRWTQIEQEKAEATRAADRLAFHKPPWPDKDDFLIINVNSNQRRKDILRSMEILVWLRTRGVPAKLLLHMSRTSDGMGDAGVDLESLGRQLGIEHGVEWAHHNGFFPPAMQLPEPSLARLYRAGDLYLSTTLGEGWGLAACEALACGCPIALPMHTACHDIMNRLAVDPQMKDRYVALKTENGGLVQVGDNSRVRYRVALHSAVERIEQFYRSGEWKRRPGLSPKVAEWMNWDRIAAEFLGLLKGEKTGRMPVVSSLPVRSGSVEGKEAKTDDALPPHSIEEVVKGLPRSNYVILHETALPPHSIEEVVKEPIAVLGCPVVNRPDLLRRMLESIDYPVGKLVIVKNSNDHVLESYLRVLPKKDGNPILWPHPVQNIEVIERGNMGVAGAWNMICMEAFDAGAPYAMIIANDIKLAPGAIGKLHAYTMEHLDHAVIFGHAHNFFTVTRKNMELVGEFDENFYPAYLEDCDHGYRIKLAGALSANCPGLVDGVDVIHGEEQKPGPGTGPLHEGNEGNKANEAPSGAAKEKKNYRASCAIFSDPVLREKNRVTHTNNFLYYRTKWGGINGDEKYLTPFKEPGGDLKAWRLDPLLRQAQQQGTALEEYRGFPRKAVLLEGELRGKP